MREAIGTRQGPVVDALVTAVVRPALRLAARRPQALPRVLAESSPRAYPVLAPAVLDIEPERAETVTVEEAFRRLGRPMPREQHLGRV